MKSVARTLSSLVRSVPVGRRHAWFTVFALVSMTGVGIAQRSQTPGDATGSWSRTGVPVHASPDVDSPRRAVVEALPPVAQAQISASIGEDAPAYHVVNGPRGLRLGGDRTVSAELTPAGVSFHHGTNRWSMSLRGYGYGSTLRKTGDTAPAGARNRVEYRRGALTEWYLNGPLGLEQGFTLHRAPGESRGEPLTLAFALSGNVTASVDAGGRSLTLRRDEVPALRYSGLTALDADGRTLRAWLEVAGDDLRVRVDDAGARYPLTIDPFIQAATLTTAILCDPAGVCDDGAPGIFFGHAVSISADASTVVVGTPYKYTNNVMSGAAYVFEKPGDFEGGWNSSFRIRFKTKLLASDGATNGQRLGWSVAISGDGQTIVAGAAGVLHPVPGAAYVFVRPASGWDAGSVQTQTAKLTPEPAASVQDWGSFGTSVATSGDGATIAVGAPDRRIDSEPYGAAYVFHRPATGWSNATGTPVATGAFASYYGASVALSEDATTLVVGAPGENPWSGVADGTGTAHVLVRQEGVGTYSTVARLGASQGVSQAWFGRSLSADAEGSTIVAGAVAGIGGAAGAAYVFVRPTAGWESTGLVLTETATLTNSNGSADDAFGISVDISGDGNTIIAGTRRDVSLGLPGAAYVFAKPAAGWAASTEDQSVMASDGTAGNWFGDSVSLSGDGTVAVVGAPRTVIDASVDQGAVYVFTGSAATPRASVSPTSLTFGSLPIGTTSAPQAVTIANTGSAPLQVSGVSVSGSFSSTQNCASRSIAPGSSCSEFVTFSPLSVGFHAGALSFTSDSGGTSGAIHDVPLQGGGEPADTSTTITSVPVQVFVGQPVIVSYAVASEPDGTLTPSGQVTVQASTGETCSAGTFSSFCVLTFSTFGDRTITASYHGNGSFNPSTSASVLVKVVDFSLSVSPSSQAVSGRKATYRVDVNALGGFGGEVSLACAGGPPDDTICTVSPASVTVSGSTARARATVTLPSRVTSGTTYTITFLGTYGGAVRSTTATLVVK
ncbi:MAG TPA: choice-of-anchor D domain-containing protein [Vicinamibacterales bacterium]|nr:choice-of-anchor D domain-containing protein [Vicinamibacterales bacterium]